MPLLWHLSRCIFDLWNSDGSSKEAELRSKCIISQKINYRGSTFREYFRVHFLRTVFRGINFPDHLFVNCVQIRGTIFFSEHLKFFSRKKCYESTFFANNFAQSGNVREKCQGLKIFPTKQNS